MKKVVYIAGPLSQGDTASNVRRAMAVGNLVLAHGCIPFVPHLSHFWDMVFPKPYEAWMEIDFEMLSRSDALVRLPGPSEGSDREVALARELGKQVLLLENYPGGNDLVRFCRQLAAA